MGKLRRFEVREKAGAAVQELGHAVKTNVGHPDTSLRNGVVGEPCSDDDLASREMPEVIDSCELGKSQK
ncbi:hypothetical protein JCM15831A_13500 [Asaia astilbis]